MAQAVAPAAAPAEIKVDQYPDSRLYVSNLSWQLSDEAFQKLFEGFGKVVEARVVRDKRTQRSRGYGFVTFEAKGPSDAAVDALHNKEVEGREIRVEKARSTGPIESKPDGERRPRGRGRGRGRGRRRGGRGGRGRRARGDADGGGAVANGDQA